MTIRATVFDLGEVDLERSNLDVIKELSVSLIEEFPKIYGTPPSRYSLASIIPSRKVFPSQPGCWCQRVARAGIRRFSNQAYLELGLGNEFSPSCDQESTQADQSFKKWKKAASDIPWLEHVEAIRHVLVDLQEAGWFLPLAQTRCYKARPPKLESGGKLITGFPSRLSDLGRTPLRRIPATSIAVKGAWADAPVSRVARELNSGCGSNLFLKRPAFRAASAGEHSDIAILLVPQNRPLSPGNPEVELVAEIESTGAIFSVCQPGSLTNRFALANILFGLAMRQGAVPWTTRLHRERVITAVDAGHMPAKQKSRWAIANYDTTSLQASVQVRDGVLEENLDDLLSDNTTAGSARSTELWRDGKLHSRDRKLIAKRFPSAGVVELIKRPDVVLFRGNLDSPEPPQPGDSVINPDGSALVQNSVASRSGAYKQPIRARSEDFNEEELCDDLLALTLRPTRSLYHTSILPAPVYFADRASKLSIDGWLRAVGNGWRLPPI